jgi:molybdopterin/thiamine biosynthesis adenylyltransferase
MAVAGGEIGVVGGWWLVVGGWWTKWRGYPSSSSTNHQEIAVAHLLQVGAGSGGMPVLDMLCRDSRIVRVTLIEPDVYKEHNVVRHLFPPAAVGELKATLAERWLKERRPDLEMRSLACDLMDPSREEEIDAAAAGCDLGVCAADNERAKFHFDAVMRRHEKPWPLGEVLSGGIGGFVHLFRPGGPCYGCTASKLQRDVIVDRSPPPDYANPGGAVAETTVPAGIASIHAIASLHAVVTLGLLDDPQGFDPGFTSLLLSLRRTPGVFEEAFRPFRFKTARAADCLICRPRPAPSTGEDLDVALAQALARLGDA